VTALRKVRIPQETNCCGNAGSSNKKLMWYNGDYDATCYIAWPRLLLEEYSPGQFAKFCALLQQNRPNSVAHCGLPFISKLSSILFKRFSFWRAGRHRDIVLSYASNGPRNYLFSFVLKVQIVKLHCVYLWLCHIVIATSKARSFLQFSLIFLW